MVVRIVLALLIVTGAGLYARSLAANRAAPGAVPDLAAVPAAPAGWQSREFRMEPDVEAVLAADAYVFREYRRTDGASVSFFAAYFADQEVGSQIHSPRNCLPGSGWSIRSITDDAVPVPAGSQPVHRMEIERGERRQEVLYWFRTRSGSITGEYALKWDLVRNSLTRRPTDAVFIRFMAAGEDRDAMDALIGALSGPLTTALHEAGLP